MELCIPKVREGDTFNGFVDTKDQRAATMIQMLKEQPQQHSRYSQRGTGLRRAREWVNWHRSV